MHIILPMPSVEWLQDKAHLAFKALNLGKVDVEIIRTNDDALIAVALPDRKTKKNEVPMTVFRFSNGADIRDKMERAFLAGAADLEKKIMKAETKH